MKSLLEDADRVLSVKTITVECEDDLIIEVRRIKRDAPAPVAKEPYVETVDVFSPTREEKIEFIQKGVLNKYGERARFGGWFMGVDNVSDHLVNANYDFWKRAVEE